MGMLQQINTTTKRIQWRTLKFVGNDQQLIDASLKCLNLLNITAYLHFDDYSQ
jgi:hypothetical protein